MCINGDAGLPRQNVCFGTVGTSEKNNKYGKEVCLF